MKALTIKDLARTEELDRTAMASVRGGTLGWPSYDVGNVNYAPSYDSSIVATQNMTQFQSVFNSTVDGSAFVDNVDAHNTTTQFGQNNIISGGSH
ncbi:hypothetical protein Q4S45_19210 [Massilia sp. R2A-15]|uniref:hypothetical protein n=1 Tax=Massilia sp. R2A-15 TaxID=3064278 RepID=UPI0027333AA6|nr:hypothetical protein [Massilia sp. R2A-15]WLI88813.1 hypothetical protein Q4S45_19210 [Massilia sp. R2A-15]